MELFGSFFLNAVSVLIDFILKERYIGGFIEVNHEREFIDIVKKYSGMNIFFSQGNTNNNLPPFSSVNIDASIFDIKVSAGAAEFKKSKEISFLKAKGEFLERLSAALPFDFFVKNKWKVDRLFSFKKKILLRELSSFNYKFFDSEYIYYGLSNLLKKNKKLSWQPSSSGCAGHFDKKKALVSAILEIIQRDSFLVYWLNTISPKKIDISSFFEKKSISCENFKELILNFEKYKISYYFLDITSDIAVPSVCCVLVIDSKTGKRLAMGASSGFEVEEVLLSSANEALSILNFNFLREPHTLPLDYKPFFDKKFREKSKV